MRDRAPVLIDYEYHRQARIQQFALTFGGWLLDRIEHFLKRHDRDDCGHYFLIVWTTQHGFGDRERHLLGGTNDLRAADDDAAPVHFCQHLADAGVDLFELDGIGLKSAVKRAVDRPERKG